MKPVILIILLSLFSSHSFSQNRIEFDAGLGRTTFSPSFINELGYDHVTASTNEFTMSLNYLRKVGDHVYIGAKVYFEKYAFAYEKDNISSDDNGFDHVDHKSSYLFFAPALDVGIGRHQRLHTYFSAGVEDMVSGYQRTHIGYDGIGGPSLDSMYISTNEINHLIFQISFGLAEHIRVNKLWHITISEGYSFMPTNLTTVNNVSDYASIHPGYLSLQIGIMRKLHMPATIEEEK